MGDAVKAALQQYDEALNKLGAYPAKPIINQLTMVAENLAMANHLSAFLTSKLHVVVPAFKLPILYLMDSILKNVGGPYVALLGAGLPPVFVECVRVVNPTDLKRFVHVLNTWEKARLFPVDELSRMRAAADAATRVAQPSNQPTSFSARPSSTSQAPARPTGDDMQLRLLLTNLQNEEGIHPAQHMSLEDVRLSNPAYYAQLLDFHKAQQQVAQPVLQPRARSPPRHQPPPQQRARSPRNRPMDSRSAGYGNPRSSRSAPQNPPPYAQRHTAQAMRHAAPMHQQPVHAPRRSPPPGPTPSRTPPMGHQPTPQKTTAEVMLILQKLQGMTQPLAAPSLKCSDIHVDKRRIDGNIYLLYEGLPYVCAGSGVRFANEKRLSEHMDFLFQYNRAQRERTKGGNSRAWYPDEEQWATDFCAVSSAKETEGVTALAQQEAEVDKDALDQARVPVDDSITKCRICGEQFSKCWDDEEEEWMYQNAVRGTIQTSPPRQTIFHKYCYDSVVAASKLQFILPSQLAPGSPLITKRGPDEDDDPAAKRIKSTDES
ncbi:hypothetical protein ACHHYP_13790 [Achlya hypogyna]|uniref:CID domain-containing protein n=1 Tax=Achlya hypogyna TaxID=1202772 RepID=A0A1V9YEN4_ACHHY|nr:hypothetical protein ACHHYP_13790 [Achlya hypogyna]